MLNYIHLNNVLKKIILNQLGMTFLKCYKFNSLRGTV